MISPAYPAFNIYSRIARTTTALGPVSVATVISRMPGWDVEVIDENNYRKFGPRDRTGHPDHHTLQTIRRADLVGLYGGLSSTIPRLYELARLYREKGVTTIAGGQHFVGDNIRDGLENGIDYLVLGEAEDTIRDLLLALREGREPAQVPGLAFQRNGQMIRTDDRAPITDFNRLPLPDFELVRYAKLKLYPVGWVRGCGMDCEFCTVKGTPRPAPAERVVEQIASVLERHRARTFFIVDDLFGHRHDESLRLCRLLADYQRAVNTRLDLTVQIRLDRARDTELLQAMRQAGISKVCIGFESPIAEELEAMNKRVKAEDMLAMTRLYHRAGFRVHGMFIFGYPLPEGQSFQMSARQRVQRFRKFIKKARLDTLQVLLPVPIPGSALAERLAAKQRVFSREIVGWEYYDGNFPLFKPDDPLTPEELQLCLRKIMGRFYRFRSMFHIGGNILIFPAMFFSLWNIKFGWRKWHRVWRGSILRFGGWIILRRWTAQLKKGAFLAKLHRAKDALPGSGTGAAK